MKDNTVKLSGHAKDRFIERYFALEETLDEATRQHLIARAKTTFTSLRVRKAALALRPVIGTKPPQKGRAAPPQIAAPEGETPLGATHGAALGAAVGAGGETPTAGGETAPEAARTAPFDPYVFGLVPIFQREGEDGLLAKLAEVTTVDNLRAMAKAQQIVLPQQLRSGDATAQSIRAGIVEAVAKRIKDRRAAAG